MGWLCAAVRDSHAKYIPRCRWIHFPEGTPHKQCPPSLHPNPPSHASLALSLFYLPMSLLQSFIHTFYFLPSLLSLSVCLSLSFIVPLSLPLCPSLLIPLSLCVLPNVSNSFHSSSSFPFPSLSLSLSQSNILLY